MNLSLKRVLIIFLIFTIVTCCLPFLLTRNGFIDFRETGQIGDTIGGIMGPFIAIAAAFLTFIAFWVQYKANLKQREDIAVERIESKYYKMLDIYLQMTNQLEVHGLKGKKAFTELVGEFTFIFYSTCDVYESLVKNEQYMEDLNEEQKNLFALFKGNVIEKYEFLTVLAYNLFFYGKKYMLYDTNEKTKLSEDIKRQLFTIKMSYSGVTYADYVKGRSHNTEHLYRCYHANLFDGHSDFLGQYFRHLYQTVKFIASLNADIVSEEQKYSYLKLLRSQMSDYEQILLYYNSLTKQGSAWNKENSGSFPQSRGYIVRYKLIKNIPINFPFLGIDPFYKYKSDNEKWKKMGKSMFEHSALQISTSSVTSQVSV